MARKITSLPFFKLYKLFRGNTFEENMECISIAHNHGMDMEKTLYSVCFCVVLLLVDMGAIKEANAYSDIMKVIVEEVKNGNDGNKRTVSGDVSGTHEER